MMHESGGWDRNRTGVRGVAVRCITILLPSRVLACKRTRIIATGQQTVNRGRVFQGLMDSRLTMQTGASRLRGIPGIFQKKSNPAYYYKSWLSGP